MITKESALVAANEIVSQAKALAAEKSSRSNLPPPLYRFPELDAIAPSRRAAVIRECMARADKQWPVILSCLAWLAGVFALWFLAPPRFQDAALAFPSVLVLGMPFVQFRRMQVRRQLRALLEAQGNDPPS